MASEMIPKGGAYSQHYQSEERERMREWQTRSSRATRDREHILSKQTAQRQRALEQKKRAMEAAEEERRRRALEERRQAQREATERCKMAISRLRLSSRTTSSSHHRHHQHRDIPIEIHYSNVGRTKEAHSSEGGGGGGRRGRGGGGGGGGRVVLGRQVELSQDTITVVRRPPPLEEVLRSIRGQPTVPKPPPSPSSSRPPPYVQLIMPSQTTPPPTATVSDDPKTTPTNVTSLQADQSDPRITTHCPIYKVQHTVNSMTLSTSTKTGPNNAPSSSSSSKSSRPTTPNPPPEEVPHAEGLVFHPVVRGPLKPRPELTKESNSIIRVVSPTQEEISSNCSSPGGSPIDSLSPGSSDNDLSSISSSTPGARRVLRRHRKKIVKKEITNKAKSDDRTLSDASNSTSSQTNASSTITSSCNKVYSDTSSDEESTKTKLSHPRSRRRRKLPPGSPSLGVANHTHNSGTPEKEKIFKGPYEAPKIVGILKKPRATGLSGLLNTSDHIDGSGGILKKSEIINDVSNGSTGAAGAIVSSSAKDRCRGEDVQTWLGESHISRDTISIVSPSTASGATKRVRFSENLESSVNCSQTSIYPSSSPPTSSSSISTNSNNCYTIGQLWKQFLDQTSAQQSLNGMYHPRMKLSLGHPRGGRENKVTEPTSDFITVPTPQVTQRLTLVEEEVEYKELKAKTTSASNSERSKNNDNKSSNEFGSEIGGKYQVSSECNSITSSSIRDKKNVSSSNEVYNIPSHQNTSSNSIWRDEDREMNSDPTSSYTADQLGKVTVAPQIYQFSPTPQNSRPLSGGGRGGGSSSGTNRYLPHRPQQKLSRYHSNNSKQLHHPVHHVTHPDTVYQSEPLYTVAMQPSSSWRLKTKSGHDVMDLSFEEQQLTHSLQKINLRLKEHERDIGPHHSHPPPPSFNPLLPPSHPSSSHPPPPPPPPHPPLHNTHRQPTNHTNRKRYK